MPKMKFGYGRKDQIAAARSEKARLEKLPFWFGTGLFDVAQVCSAARMMKAKHGIGMVTVDYVQQLDASELGRGNENTVQRVTFVMRRLKHLALELDVPVVVLSQLSREVEKEGRSPQLSDLRDSGAIEQDAEKVLFLYIDRKKRKAMEEAKPGSTKHKRPVWCDVLKHKDGETGALEMWLLPPYFDFVMAGPEWEDDALPGAVEAGGGDRRPQTADRRPETGDHAGRVACRKVEQGKGGGGAVAKQDLEQGVMELDEFGEVVE
jgi:replicative DNA helicase